MKVQVIRSFSARVDGRILTFSEGEVYDIDEPDLLSDWLNAGFVKPAEVEKAIRKAPETTAGKPASRKKTTTKRAARAKKNET